MRIKMLPALAGDCFEIIIEDEVPRMVIIDGGMGRACRAMLKYDVYDWTRNYGPVDLAILTHIDNDHIDGILSLVSEECFDNRILAEMWFNYGENLEKGQIRDKILNRIYLNDDSCLTSNKQGRELYQVLKSKKIPLVAPITSGMVKEFGQYRIEVISPSTDCLEKFVNSKEYQYRNNDLSEIQTSARKKDYERSIEELLGSQFDENSVTKANASSIAVMITGPNCKALFLGDAKSSEVERGLRIRGYSEDNPLVLDFLKVSHHGSSHSTSDSLIRILDCSNYLISTNWNGLPTKECLARIVANSRNAVTFWCNYEPETSIFTDNEYEKYRIQFKNIGSTEIEVNGRQI